MENWVLEDERFEAERRARETHNEMVTNALWGVALLAGFLVHTANTVLHFLPLDSPPKLMALLGAGTVASLVLHLHLRRRPPYSTARKYLITAAEFGLVTVAANMMSLVLPMLALMVSLALYLFLIVLAGLRYSRTTLLMAGGLGVVCQLTRALVLGPEGMKLPVAILSTVVLTATTVAAVYSLASMLRLHQESVVKSRLQRFLAPELVDEVVRNPGLLEQRTERRMGTVLFTDIRGFTTLSEQCAPEQMVAVLNRAFDEMAEAVLERHGMVDKFIGDAMMAVFGVPVAGEDHADRALAAALSIRERMASLNEALASEGLEPLGFGIGLHSGPLVVGAIGARQRQDYTVIGDTVNVASRVEGLTRSYAADILLTRETRAHLRDDAAVVQVGRTAVKGRAEEVELWKPA